MEKYLSELKSKLASEGIVYLRLKVIPNAGKTEFITLMDDQTLKMRVKAVPEKGKANREIEKFLGKYFGSRCEVVGGKATGQKLVKLFV